MYAAADHALRGPRCREKYAQILAGSHACSFGCCVDPEPEMRLVHLRPTRSRGVEQAETFSILSGNLLGKIVG